MSSIVLLALLGSATALALLWLGLRRWRKPGRGGAAAELCGLLDAYVRLLATAPADAAQADARWGLLEQARRLQQHHFPELYAEMLAVSRAHRDLAGVWLKAHMERHGAPTGWDALDTPEHRRELHHAAAAAARQLQERCRERAARR
jgi:hypothetical protein